MKPTSDAQEIRQSEIGQLLRWASAVESAVIVGVSGVGKSNLFRSLLNPGLLTGQSGEITRLVRVNFHDLPEYSLRGIFSLILDQIAASLAGMKLDPRILEQIQHSHELLLDSHNDLLKVQHYFKHALGEFMADPQQKLILLCDQFDPVYIEADPVVFANLRGLRETYKYRLAYFIFTRQPLEELAESDAGREEFHELLINNLLWLRPYNEHDARIELGRIAGRFDYHLDDPVAHKIFELCGGHGGLLRAVLLQVINSQISMLDDTTDPITWVTKSQISTECSKLWNSLSQGERRILKLFAHNLDRSVEMSSPAGKDLLSKGLLDERGRIFSPIFSVYAGSQDAPWEKPLSLDEPRRQVWLYGKPGERLTAQEFKLYKRLEDGGGGIVNLDEIAQALHPDAKGGVTEQSITAAIYRLRKKIEPNPDQPQFLLNAHDSGYQLVLSD
jgi:hypothetical protein